VSGAQGILDFPHYTRPAEFRGWSAPEILLSGDHEKIRRWRRRTALAKTRKNRPDLLQSAQLSNEDRALLKEIEADEAKGPF
jgi:tRNA (guanine37-N1)-methyltransferase